LSQPGLRHTLPGKSIRFDATDCDRTVSKPAHYGVPQRREYIPTVIRSAQIGRADAAAKLMVVLITHAEFAHMNGHLGHGTVPRQRPTAILKQLC
jgi:hypothetical protein